MKMISAKTLNIIAVEQGRTISYRVLELPNGLIYEEDPTQADVFYTRRDSITPHHGELVSVEEVHNVEVEIDGIELIRKLARSAVEYGVTSMPPQAWELVDLILNDYNLSQTN